LQLIRPGFTGFASRNVAEQCIGLANFYNIYLNLICEANTLAAMFRGANPAKRDGLISIEL